MLFALLAPWVIDYLFVGSAILANLSYGVWSVLGTTAPFAVYSTIFVAGAIFRFLNLSFSSATSEMPEIAVFKDMPVLTFTALWIVSLLVLLYAHPSF